jgi:hypothetical protein
MIPVEGKEGLFRDPKTDAIIMINRDEIEKRKRLKAIKRKQRLEQQQEVQDLKNEVSELKDMLRQLLEKR